MALILIIGYGNPSRGDDALGPALLEWLEQERDAGGITVPFDTITDFQLQIEHALDLRGRELVLFVDSSVSLSAPYRFSKLHPERDLSYTTHAISPTSLLVVYQQAVDEMPPESFLLEISGRHFELGEDMSDEAIDNLSQASRFVSNLLQAPDAEAWLKWVEEPDN